MKKRKPMTDHEIQLTRYSLLEQQQMEARQQMEVVIWVLLAVGLFASTMAYLMTR